MSNSLQPHGLQHSRLPCPSLSPEVYSNSCPLSWWCHPTISFFVIPLASCLQSFPASGAFPMSWLFTSGGQSNGVSASAPVLPMNIHSTFKIVSESGNCSPCILLLSYFKFPLALAWIIGIASCMALSLILMSYSLFLPYNSHMDPSIS